MYKLNQLSANEILSTYESLPPWDPQLDADPNWIRPVTDFGWVQIERNETHKEVIRRVGWRLRHGYYRDVRMDPSFVQCANQPTIRLDALVYYFDNEKLFDKDSWYGVDIPVVTEWADSFVVLDGTHRILSDQLMRRSSRLVRFVSQKLHGL